MPTRTFFFAFIERKFDFSIFLCHTFKPTASSVIFLQMGTTSDQILLQQLQKEHGLDPESLMKDIKRYLKEFNEKKFLKAYRFAAVAHDSQERKSGEPYIIHPYEAMRILTSLHVDEDTLIAALLHDVPEDTDFTIGDIESRFGKKVAFLVEGITKLSKVHYQNDMATRQVESLKKLFIHTAEDPRIILIKLADRLHNMRTLHFVENPEKRERIARETLEIFVPIANLLGIDELKSELEDLCFRALYPEDYELLADRMRLNRERNLKALDKTISMVGKELKDQGIEASVMGRMRNLYSIYKRVTADDTRMEEFDKQIALRILVMNNDQCYKTLGILHGLFRPKSGHFMDYIAVPKRNGYQSLHTEVFGPDGVTVCFQIRTHRMHREAQYGIASLYFEGGDGDAKNGHKGLHLLEDERARWVSKAVQLQKNDGKIDGEEFMTHLMEDILHDRIFVFTPRGDAVDLPKGATCIDFAYEIHTEVGHRALRAEVNGKIMPMATKLVYGDTVNIITSDIAKGPSRQWLAFAKTNTARNRIMDYFKKVSRNEKFRTGLSLLQKELNRAGLGLVKTLSRKQIRLFCSQNDHCRSLDDILIHIGEGTLNPIDVVNMLDAQKSAEKVEKKRSAAPYKTICVKVVCRDGVGQYLKILSVFREFQLNILRTKAYVSLRKGCFVARFVVCLKNYAQISQLFEHLEQVEGVVRVERTFWQRKVLFFTGLIFTFLLWLSHPFLLLFLVNSDVIHGLNPLMEAVVMYAGIFMLYVMVVTLKSFTQRSFPELRENGLFWVGTFALSTFAMFTIFAEIYFLNLDFNWALIVVLIVGIFAYLILEYMNFREQR